jgi:hypothetical protein
MDDHCPIEPQHHASEHFPFLSLPAELRNQIYDLSLPHEQTFAIGSWRPNTRPMQPALTQVCKQIRSEALPMFVAKNQFRVKASTDFARRTGSTQISRPISFLLQSLEIEICPYSSTYSLAVVKDLEGIWTCNIESHRAFHLPANHVDFWTRWLDSLSAYQDEDGCLRCKDLSTLIQRLQKWN